MNETPFWRQGGGFIALYLRGGVGVILKKELEYKYIESISYAFFPGKGVWVIEVDVLFVRAPR